MTNETITRAAADALQPGEKFAGGYFGGLINTPAGLHAIAWAPKNGGQHTTKLLPEAKTWNSPSTNDSAANTQALAAAGSAIAQKALDAEINGVRGWLIPAADVLELGYRLLKPTTEETYCGYRDGENHNSVPPGLNYTWNKPEQTKAAQFQDSSPEAFDDSWYHSSTEYSPARAWDQLFHYGDQYTRDASVEARVRFVRLIPVA